MAEIKEKRFANTMEQFEKTKTVINEAITNLLEIIKKDFNNAMTNTDVEDSKLTKMMENTKKAFESASNLTEKELIILTKELEEEQEEG